MSELKLWHYFVGFALIAIAVTLFDAAVKLKNLIARHLRDG
jgi:hypothetical protein